MENNKENKDSKDNTEKQDEKGKIYKNNKKSNIVKDYSSNKYNYKDNELKLIPKVENYIKHMLGVLLKLPRTEKFSIGTDYKSSMYQMLREILYLGKVDLKDRLSIIRKADAELSFQRIMLRLMKDQKWIDYKKFDYVIELISEIGKMIGGLEKYYADYCKKCI